jgi:hypothetical protein
MSVKPMSAYLQDLLKQKSALVDALNDCGLESSTDEKLNTLVPKVSQVYNSGQLSVISSSERLRGNLSGVSVSATDVSPVKHCMGVSVASKNLLPYPYINHYTSASILSNGITFTDNGDGTITINGQNDGSGNSFFYFRLNAPITLKAGTYIGSMPNGMQFMAVTVSGQYIAFNNAKIFEEDTQINSMYLQAAKGSTTIFENVIAYPMLEKGSTKTAYTPYVDTSSVVVTRSGKNLFDPSNYPKYDKCGITIEYLPKEDCFLFNGTFTGSTNDVYKLKLDYILGNIGDKYSISAHYISGGIDIPSGYVRAYFGVADSLEDTTETNWLDTTNMNMDINNPAKRTLGLTQQYISHFWFLTSTGVHFDDYKVRIQLEKGDKATDYEKHVEPTEYTPNADGTVDGVMSLYPSTVLTTDNPDVTISMDYFKDIDKAFAELEAQAVAVIPELLEE